MSQCFKIHQKCLIPFISNMIICILMYNMAFVKAKWDFFVIFKYCVLWRKSKDAGDLFCTFSSFGPRPIIRDPNNRKLRGPIMILKCTTTQDWHLAMARSSGVSSQRKEMKDFEQPIFFANCVAVNFGVKVHPYYSFSCNLRDLQSGRRRRRNVE